jgi:toxin ParE1/3/4
MTCSGFRSTSSKSGSETGWLNAEDEIFEKLALVDTGFLTRAPIQELSSVGIFEYQNVGTSHHKLVYRRIDGDVFVYAIGGHWQDFPTLLIKRLLKMTHHFRHAAKTGLRYRLALQQHSAESRAGGFLHSGIGNARLRGHFACLAEWTGLAYTLQAADSLASESLLAPPKAAQAAFSTPELEMPACAGILHVWRSGRDSNPRPPA